MKLEVKSTIMEVFKLRVLFTRKNFLIALTFFTASLLTFCSGSDDDNDAGNNDSMDMGEEISIDLDEISGEYAGLASNTTVSDDISMRITPRSAEGQYAIEFFGFSDLTPCCNSDARPDGTGSLSLENDQVSISINWSSDSPPCTGTYMGTGGSFGSGRIIIEMIVDLNCLANEDTQLFNIMKIADL